MIIIAWLKWYNGDDDGDGGDDDDYDDNVDDDSDESGFDDGDESDTNENDFKFSCICFCFYCTYSSMLWRRWRRRWWWWWWEMELNLWQIV